MSIAAFRTALAETLRSVEKLRASEYMTDEIVPPHAMFDFTVEPDLTFARGHHLYKFRVQVFTSRSSDVPAQKYLDLLRDPTTAGGVVQTIGDSALLAAVCDYARVTNVGEVQLATVGAIEYLMVPFDVEVVI